MTLQFDETKRLMTLLDEDCRKKVHHSKIHKNDIIYQQNESPTSFFEVQSGYIGLISITEDGKETLHRVFKKGHFFGHRTILSDEKYHATTIALTDAELNIISKEDFISQINTNHQLLLHVTQVLAKELRRSENKYSDLVNKKVEARIVQTLAFLKTRYPAYKWTRREIGEYCGAKTETVSRILSKLESADLITKKGRDIVIKDLLHLYHYADRLKD